MTSSTLLYFTITLALYYALDLLHQRCRHHALLNPLAWTVVLLVIGLRRAGVAYATYFSAVHFLHFLLGPATVALAVPLYEKRREIARAGTALVASLFVGSLTGILSSLAIALALGAPGKIARTLAPKSVTSPIAMAIAEHCGGIPSMAAMVVIVTGIFGAATLPPLFDLLRIRSEKARGFAMGLAAHGMGTARAFQLSNEMGAFAGLAIGLNGLLTSVLVPVLLNLLKIT